jgi:hypothetical protein
MHVLSWLHRYLRLRFLPYIRELFPQLMQVTGSSQLDCFIASSKHVYHVPGGGIQQTETLTLGKEGVVLPKCMPVSVAIHEISQQQQVQGNIGYETHCHPVYSQQTICCHGIVA